MYPEGHPGIAEGMPSRCLLSDPNAPSSRLVTITIKITGTNSRINDMSWIDNTPRTPCAHDYRKKKRNFARQRSQGYVHCRTLLVARDTSSGSHIRF